MDLSLYVITDRRLSGRSHEEQAEMAIAEGATAVQLRDKELPAGPLVQIGRRLSRMCRQAGVLFVVNDRADVALACDADGVHLGQDDLPPQAARAILGRGKIIGCSAGTVEEAVRAQAAGANYVGAGSVFPTASKPDAGPAIGIEVLRQIIASIQIPVVAIGGVNASNAAEVIHAGAAGVAVISAVVGQPDITAAARTLREVIDAVRNRR